MADFTTIKTYAAQTAESAPGVLPASYATVPGLPKQRNRSRLVELRLGGTPAVGGTANPASVVLSVWRLNKTDGTKDYLTAWTIAAADITAGTVAPLIIETWANEITTQCTFVGGTTPTFTGTVQARALE